MKNILLLLALTNLAAMVSLPGHTYPQPGTQAWHNQQALGAYMTDEWNKRRSAEAAAQQELPGRRANSYLVGLNDEYGAIVIDYRDSILLDNYSKPLPFSWERYRDMTSDIDGKRLEELSPFGDYQPFSKSISRAATAQQAEAAARKSCNSPNCKTAAVYANTCNAIAAGWLKDYSGVRIYTAGKAYYLDNYSKGDVNNWDLAYRLVQPAIADALRRCRNDPAVHAASCEAPGHKEQADYCALPDERIEWR